MIKLIYLNKFNNYYNRKLIRYDNVNNYTSGRAYVTATDINFNPNDGVTGSQIVNWTYQDSDNQTLEYEWNPDYVLVVEQTGSGMIQSSVIKSRWFVTEFVRTRFGQYNATLKRDVLADFKYYIINSPAYIEKGVISNNSTLLYNSEGVNVSQIKKDEIPLYDETGCPWLVAYLAKNTLTSQTELQVNRPNDSINALNLPYSTIQNWPFYKYSEESGLNHKEAVMMKQLTVQADVNDNTISFTNNRGLTIDFYSQFVEDSFTQTKAYLVSDLSKIDGSSNIHILPAAGNILSLLDIYTDNCRNVCNYWLHTAMAEDASRESADIWPVWEKTQTFLNTQYNPSTLVPFDVVDLSDIIKLANSETLVKTLDGKYYQITLIPDTKLTNVNIGITSSQTPDLYQTLNDTFKEALRDNQQQVVDANDHVFDINIQLTGFTLHIEERTELEVKGNLENVSVLSDSPLYDMLCMPYGEVQTWCGGAGWTSNAEDSLLIMSDMCAALGKDKVYDLQLLPYCPVREMISQSGGTTTVGTSNTKAGLIFEDNADHVKGIAFSVSRTDFSFDIQKSIMLPDPNYDYIKHSTNEFNEIDKYESDCTSLRLCSPNYNGIFEFNIAKNDGSIEYFNVDVTLKPFTPYIHMNPNFKLFYDKDYDDARGLICGGDFSLGMLDNAFVQYETQNKYYQNLFDREIQNMDKNYSIEQNQRYWSNTIGLATGTVVGGAAKGFGGMAAGAAAGTTSLALSTEVARQKYAEARDYAIDKFNMNLATIKALPNSITRTSALTHNNKLVPFIEVYEPTEEEKEAYFNKLYYEGMTIGVIGKITDYILPNEMSYVKAKLIMNDTIAEDTHMFNEINNELEKGIYIL